MKARQALAGSGAAGVVLAALVYFLATRVGGVLRSWVALREAEVFVFIILFGVSLLEMPVMVFGLRTLYREEASKALVCMVNGFYVTFASFYAAVLVMLFGESGLSVLLAGLSVARWASDWWIK